MGRYLIFVRAAERQTGLNIILYRLRCKLFTLYNVPIIHSFTRTVTHKRQAVCNELQTYY